MTRGVPQLTHCRGGLAGGGIVVPREGRGESGVAGEHGFRATEAILPRGVGCAAEYCGAASAMSRKSLGDLAMPCQSCQEERLASIGVLELSVSPVVEQCLHAVRRAFLHSGVERSPAFHSNAKLSVGVCTGAEESCDTLRLLHHARNGERRESVIADAVRFGTGGEEKLHEFSVSMHAGHVQRDHVVARLQVEILATTLGSQAPHQRLAQDGARNSRPMAHRNDLSSFRDAVASNSANKIAPGGDVTYTPPSWLDHGRRRLQLAPPAAHDNFSTRPGCRSVRRR